MEHIHVAIIGTAMFLLGIFSNRFLKQEINDIKQYEKGYTTGFYHGYRRGVERGVGK